MSGDDQWPMTFSYLCNCQPNITVLSVGIWVLVNMKKNIHIILLYFL